VCEETDDGGQRPERGAPALLSLIIRETEVRIHSERTTTESTAVYDVRYE